MTGEEAQRLLWDGMQAYRRNQFDALAKHLLAMDDLVRSASALVDDPIAFRKALTALCDEEYGYSGDCEAFGGVCEKLGIEEDPDEVQVGVDKIVEGLDRE